MVPSLHTNEPQVSPSRPSPVTKLRGSASPLHLAEQILAAFRGPGTLCLSLPAPDIQPSSLLTSELAETSFQWADSDGSQVAGADAVHDLRSSGTDRFARLRDAAQSIGRRLQPLSIAGAPKLNPRFFGGLAFAPGSRLRDWNSFGDARFILPRWQIDVRGGWSVLTLGVRADELKHRAQRHLLLEALETRLSVTSTNPRTNQPIYDRPSRITQVAFPSRQSWAEMVQAARDAIIAGQFQKLVAAQVFEIELDELPTSAALLAALRISAENLPADDVVRFAFRFDQSTFLGATPETLVGKTGRQVWSEALAGTAPRETPPSRFLDNSKDRHEHQLVVDAITRNLGSLCSSLAWAPVPRVRALGHLQHLHTPISGHLTDNHHLLDLAAALHPTPAVGGLPSAEAVSWIATHEPFDRGWYGGPVGWFDRRGDGELRVALRCALASGRRIKVPAGAGLVAASEAADEYRETELKANTMIQRLAGEALGLTAGTQLQVTSSQPLVASIKPTKTSSQIHPTPALAVA